jgi:hypothetical protein
VLSAFVENWKGQRAKTLAADGRGALGSLALEKGKLLQFMALTEVEFHFQDANGILRQSNCAY